MKNEIEQLQKSKKWDYLFLTFSFALIPVTIMALTFPPVIASQGQAHRIFYIHVPVAWVALYAPILASITGILYLLKKEEKYDIWSLVASRISLVFAIGVVVTGPIWASTEWGTYWNWKDSRLMSFFILFMALGGYFIVRTLTEDPSQKATYSAFMAILAAVTALLTWFAIRIITPDTHPTSIIKSMSPKIRITFWISVLGYHLLFLAMLRASLRQEKIHRIMQHLANRK